MDRRVLIVGASSGIGRACAEKFVKRGDRVFNISRRNADIKGVTDINADVTNADELRAAFDKLSSTCRTLDVFMYFAGYSMAAPIEHVDREDVRYLFDVNVIGLIDCFKRAVPMMKEHGGHAVFASSLGGHMPILYDAFYTASKAAVDAFAAEASMELAQFNIKITSAVIGGTRTDFSYKRNYYSVTQCGEYADDVRRAAAILYAIEQRGMSPKSAAKRITALTEKENPPVVRGIGIVNRGALAAVRLMPKKHLLTAARLAQGLKKA